MIVLTPEVALVAALTTGVGAAMIRLGLSRGLLQLRNVEQRCPACGRLTRDHVCPRCGGSRRVLRSAPARRGDRDGRR